VPRRKTPDILGELAGAGGIRPEPQEPSAPEGQRASVPEGQRPGVKVTLVLDADLAEALQRAWGEALARGEQVTKSRIASDALRRGLGAGAVGGAANGKLTRARNVL